MAVAQNAAAQAAARQQQNNIFMNQSFAKPFSALAQNGTSYVPGQALNFDAPVIPGGYLEALRVTVSLSVTYTAAGSGPTVALNAGGLWNTIQQINVKYGETAISVHPYFENIFRQMRGYGRQQGGIGQTLANQNASVQGMIYKSPTLNAGANNWLFTFTVPMNNVHPASVNGLLPLGQTGTKAQIQIVPPSSFVGADPLNNVVSTNGTIAVTGNISITAMVRDYQSFSTVQAVEPDLTGLATVQTIKPQEINPLTAGSYNFRTLSNPYPLVRYAVVVIDGQSSTKFCDYTNINGYELDQAENTNSAFFRYDSTTGGFNNYLLDIRERFGQDFDNGILVFDAPSMNQANPSNQGGNNWLNLTSGGYPAARWGVNVGTVSSANGITPRAVMYASIINPNGISIV